MKVKYIDSVIEMIHRFVYYQAVNFKKKMFEAWPDAEEWKWSNNLLDELLTIATPNTKEIVKKIKDFINKADASYLVTIWDVPYIL